VFEGIEIEPALKESLLLNIKRRMTPKGTCSDKGLASAPGPR
jgi:hypothetical protein